MGTLNGGLRYVDRGDPVDYDFTINDLITDQDWHDLDLSNIIPENVLEVRLRVRLRTPSLAGIQFRKKGNVNVINVSMKKVPVVNVYYHGDVRVTCNKDRVIQYLAGPVSWIAIDITVRGWFIKSGGGDNLE